ncbi:MAG: hypothetical protein N2505_00190 [Endomicrobia bacterium]|nr:hypothetical protein [Endomicrobiia bacterium]
MIVRKQEIKYKLKKFGYEILHLNPEFYKNMHIEEKIEYTKKLIYKILKNDIINEKVFVNINKFMVNECFFKNIKNHSNLILEITEEEEELDTDLLFFLRKNGFSFFLDDVDEMRVNEILNDKKLLYSINGIKVNKNFVSDMYIKEILRHEKIIIQEKIETYRELYLTFKKNIYHWQGFYLKNEPKVFNLV